MPTEMLTYHHSFSTRIFPYGEPGTGGAGSAGSCLAANRAFIAASQFSSRRPDQPRRLNAAPPASRVNERSGLFGKTAPHAH
jgi:hypothetical protein